MTNETGQVVRRHHYFPFGEEYLAQGGNDPLRFSGKERDAETGLDYFGARYYASRTGRFTTVDPALAVEGSLANPQLWNRYAYGLNNPHRYVDPDGRWVWLATLVQRVASSPAVQRVQQFAAAQGARLWVAATRLFNTPQGQELVQTAAELATGADLGPAASIRSEIAGAIAGGHAFTKHANEFADLGVRTKSQFARLVEGVLQRAAGGNVKYLQRGVWLFGTTLRIPS